MINGESKTTGKEEFLADEISADDHSQIAETKKSGSSSRKGKMQREKRMLRQKRRSTGVVNIKDVEESEKVDSVSAMEFCTLL